MRLNFGSRPPKRDKSATGTLFIDVLFAYVVAKILDFSVDGHLSGAAKTQLALAAIVTITSWIGYHNSANRQTYEIRFANWPLVHFLIDIALVYCYWLLAAVAERRPGAVPDAMPEAILLVVIATLYVGWDVVSQLMRTGYGLPASSAPARKYVSWAYLVFCLAVLLVVGWKHPDTQRMVIAVDVVLIVATIVYRFMKEWVTPRQEVIEADAEAVEN